MPFIRHLPDSRFLYFRLFVFFLFVLSGSLSGQNPPGRPPAVPAPRPPVGRPAPSSLPRPVAGRPAALVDRPTRNRPAHAPFTKLPARRPPVSRPPVHRPAVIHRPPGWGAARPPYTRPPHIYHGRRYYSYHRYYYHPYRPYTWGPSWHPVGFFLNNLAAAAIIVTINNAQFRYFEGVYYAPYQGGYQVVAPPLGAVIPVLPAGYVTVNISGYSDFYYYGGCFYSHSADGYQVAQAPAGAIVYQLPDGCVSVHAGSVTYLKYNDVLYKPIVVNGQPAYEVMEVEQ